ncbi:MAG: Mu-like prophage major head subunit gpT family protein [Phycisphaerales bacterium]
MSKSARSLRLCAPVGELVAAKHDDAKDGASSPRRFGMVAYTGGAMRLAGWPHPVVVDLAGMQVSAKSRPILKDHNPSLIVGHTDSVRIEGSQLLVSGVISGAGAVAQEIVVSSLAGFPWQASLGASASNVETVPKGKSAQANGQTFEGPVQVVRRSRLGEVSFVALGADDDTSAQIAAHNTKENSEMDFQAWLTDKGFDAEALTEAQSESLRAMYDAAQASDETNAAATATVDGPNEGDGSAVAGRIEAGGMVADMRAEAAAETQRIAEVRRLCTPGNGKHAELEAKAIGEGWDASRTELELLRAERPQVSGVRTGSDAQTPHAIEASLCLSAGLSESQVGELYDERAMNAALSRDMRGAGIHTLLYETIRAAGGTARAGRIDNETIRAAFSADRQLLQAAGGAGFSTISLTGILSNVANKTMLAAYQAVPSVASSIAAETDVSDFKEVTRYRLTGVGLFEKVGPDGELKSAELSEEAFTSKVETYGRMITLTRQMIINDDLGAFLQIPRLIGRMSALKREEALFELLLSNPGSFFGAGNNNFLSGAQTALSIDGLTDAEQLFLDQTDSEGKPILLSAKTLLVPTSLKVTAEQLMTETRVNQFSAEPALASNPHAGKFTVVSTPYLNAQAITGGSALAWYLFADPADIAALEVAYLRGKRVPTIESGDTNFNTLGVQWRGFFDFGVSVQDSRAAVKVKGEA